MKKVASVTVYRRCVFCGGKVETLMIEGRVSTLKHVDRCEPWQALPLFNTMEEALAYTTPPPIGDA